MIPGVLPAVDAHYRRMQVIQAVAVKAGRQAWGRIDERFLSESWTTATRSLIAVVSATQVQAAMAGSEYGAGTIAEQGIYEPPQAFVDPVAFSGYASDGRSMDGLLESPITSVKDLIGSGMPAAEALTSGRNRLDTILRTTVADAGRQAGGVDTMARTGFGYVRMLNPPSCRDCIIQAGKFFRWNAGFLRHPRCDCVHVSTTISGARAEGLVDDPYEYFNGLSAAEQDRMFGRDNAQAIRDGADIYQVENRRLRGPGSTTTNPGGRLTPEDIYRQAGSRAEALRLLQREGYILPGGQVPGGVIRGNREGFGALGRGGARVGVREAIERARRTGVRDPSVRATMTEAERRMYDATTRWQAVIDGRNPFGRGPLTPALAAQAERDFRRWLSTNGQIFTN